MPEGLITSPDLPPRLQAGLDLADGDQHAVMEGLSVQGVGPAGRCAGQLHLLIEGMLLIPSPAATEAIRVISSKERTSL